MLLDATDDLFQARLHDDAPNDHLSQNGMQRLKTKNEIQLADVGKEAVQRFDKDLNEVDEREGGLGRRADEDEVQRRIVAVGYERRCIGVNCCFRRRLDLGGVGGKERRESVAQDSQSAPGEQ